MNEAKKIAIAKIAIRKRWDFETLKYSDDLYGNSGKLRYDGTMPADECLTRHIDAEIAQRAK